MSFQEDSREKIHILTYHLVFENVDKFLESRLDGRSHRTLSHLFRLRHLLNSAYRVSGDYETGNNGLRLKVYEQLDRGLADALDCFELRIILSLRTLSQRRLIEWELMQNRFLTGRAYLNGYLPHELAGEVIRTHLIRAVNRKSIERDASVLSEEWLQAEVERFAYEGRGSILPPIADIFIIHDIVVE